MVSHHHTAPPCPLDSNKSEPGPTLNLDSTLPTRSSGQEKRLSPRSRQACIALAVRVIDGLLRADDALSPQHNAQRSSHVLPNALQRNGLQAALYFLHHHVDTHTTA
ncbi:hypothetical protein GCM10010872_09350 [Dyella flava]|nr:hypothetical protein GCM10010872_09350 [Dyella flava]